MTALIQAWEKGFSASATCEASLTKTSQSSVGMSSSQATIHLPSLPVQRVSETVPPREENNRTQDTNAGTEVSIINEEESSECTASIDLDPIGNSSSSSLNEPDTSTSQDVIITTTTTTSETETGHKMITRSKTRIVKPNPRYALLTQQAHKL